MSQLSAAQITKLCDDWCAVNETSENRFVLRLDAERSRLLRNGVVFHKLDHETLCAALLGLSKVLLLPGLHTVIDEDHYALWSWCGELLLGHGSLLFPSNQYVRNQYEIGSLYRTAIHAALASRRNPVATKEEQEAQRQSEDIQPHHAKQLISKSSLVLAYLAFPLLEAVVKRACETFVSLDGQVISHFEVCNKQGDLTTYDPRGRKHGKSKCSSLRDLLVLHHDQVAEPELRRLLDTFQSHISRLNTAEKPYDLIYSWRNPSLHGTTNFGMVGGTVLNLSLAISLFKIRSDFEQHKSRALENARWEASSGYRKPDSFYIPRDYHGV